MKEFDFIDILKSNLINNEVELGIGDDAACFNNTLIAKDIMIEDIHFTLKASIEKIIFKLFTANVSDIAAMGGIAKYVLLGLAIPHKRINSQELINAIIKAANYYNLKIIGGDTTSSNDKLFLSLTITGEKGKYLLTRKNAQKDDIVCISRPVGFAALSLMQELEEIDFGIKEFYHYTLKAEYELGKLLGNSNSVTSCIDISDGLSSELNHLAKQSNVKIIIDKNKLPLDELKKYSENALSLSMQSGEEYALLFTVKQNEFLNLKKIIYDKLQIKIIEIGIVDEGKPAVIFEDNSAINFTGYEHRF